MTSLNVIAATLQQAARRCQTAAWGTNEAAMRKALNDTATDLATVIGNIGNVREIGPDGDLYLSCLASRMLQLWSRGDVAGAKDDWLRVWAYMKRAEQEAAA